MWLMDGLSVLSATDVGKTPITSRIAGVSDFDADGKPEVLWRDTSGDVFMWVIRKLSFVANIWSGWSIVGVGDFNGDGGADILWRNTTGEVSIWLMDGPTLSSYRDMGNVADRMAQ
jgi:hypothetical protein